MSYSCDNKYLFEIVEDYKESDNKQEILESFYKNIWNCKNKRIVYKKNISYLVKPDLINTEIGQLFNDWSKINYYFYK